MNFFGRPGFRFFTGASSTKLTNPEPAKIPTVSVDYRHLPRIRNRIIKTHIRKENPLAAGERFYFIISKLT